MKRQDKQYKDQIIYLHSIGSRLEIYKHGERVCQYSILLGKLLNLDASTMGKLKIASKEHDIGKIICPPEILNKPETLTEKERKIIQNHPRNSVKLYVENSPSAIDMDIARAIKAHHENFDGSGYPDNLAGTNIPYIARIIRITDSFDALTQERCYKKAVPCDEALGSILYTSRWYDPDMLRLFVESFDEFVNLFNTIDELIDFNEDL